MNYTIEPVNIKDPQIDNQLRALIKDAFKLETPISPGHLYKNTVTNKSKQETLFLVAREGGKIIGCNGFMATDFTFNGETTTCFQSCWSATHPEHQGKKIFVNIINEGKRILKEKGAGFIYGVPNDNSHPIFIKKLGFKEIPSKMVKIFNLPLLKTASFAKNVNEDISAYKASTFCPVEDQIIDLKNNIETEEVIKITENKSFIWGKLKTKNTKAGLKLKYFYLGGMDLDKVQEFKILIAQVFKKFKVHYIQIVSCEANLYNKLINNWKPTSMNGFIFYELNSGAIENANLFYGAIDVF